MKSHDDIANNCFRFSTDNRFALIVRLLVRSCTIQQRFALNLNKLQSLLLLRQISSTEQTLCAMFSCNKVVDDKHRRMTRIICSRSKRNEAKHFSKWQKCMPRAHASLASYIVTERKDILIRMSSTTRMRRWRKCARKIIALLHFRQRKWQQKYVSVLQTSKLHEYKVFLWHVCRTLSSTDRRRHRQYARATNFIPKSKMFDEDFLSTKNVYFRRTEWEKEKKNNIFISFNVSSLGLSFFCFFHLIFNIVYTKRPNRRRWTWRSTCYWCFLVRFHLFVI